MNKRYMDFVPVKKTELTAEGAVAPARAERAVQPERISRVERASQAERSAKVEMSLPEVKKPVVKLPEVETVRRVRTERTEVRRPMSLRARTGETEIDDFEMEEIFEEKPVPAGVTVPSSVKMGVIEDMGPKFVKTEVEKRPLSGAKKASLEDEIREAKAEKLTGRRLPHRKLSAYEGAMTKIAAKRVTSEKTEVEPVEKPVENSEDLTPEKVEKDAATKKEATMSVPKFVNLEKVKKRPLSKNVYQKQIKVEPEEKKGPVTIIAKPEKDSKVGMVVAIIITIILGATAGTVAFLLLPK